MNDRVIDMTDKAIDLNDRAVDLTDREINMAAAESGRTGIKICGLSRPCDLEYVEFPHYILKACHFFSISRDSEGESLERNVYYLCPEYIRQLYDVVSALT